MCLTPLLKYVGMMKAFPSCINISFYLFIYIGKVESYCNYVKRLVCKDITGGQEDIPIPATNLVDDPPVPPTGMLS